MDDNDKMARIEERVYALEREQVQQWTAHDKVHQLEERARALALAALQSQTRLILGIATILVSVAAAALYLKG